MDALVDGGIADDSGDYRPGIRAAAEAGVLSPLAEAGFTKEEVRAACRALGLEVAERPASPCLASRFPYGESITAEALEMVAAAESLLRRRGFPVCRVRHHGECGPHRGAGRADLRAVRRAPADRTSRRAARGGLRVRVRRPAGLPLREPQRGTPVTEQATAVSPVSGGAAREPAKRPLPNPQRAPDRLRRSLPKACAGGDGRRLYPRHFRTLGMTKGMSTIIVSRKIQAAPPYRATAG